MFSYTGLSKEQVQSLKFDFHIYMLDSGRVSVPGCKPLILNGLMIYELVNNRNVKYVAEAINQVVRQTVHNKVVY